MKWVMLGLFSALQCGCVSRMFYYPDKQIYETPSQPFEEIQFASADGTRLHGWWIPATIPVKGTVVYLHGNAANITGHYCQIEWLPASGYNVFLFDYRGYGKSEGQPSRRGVYADCVAAMDYAAKRADRLFASGQSLGGANAMAVLGRND